jgi:predicted ArsR family transcriptional regulator
MIEVLQCLKKHGQRLDLEIAKEIGLPLATVRTHLASLVTMER